MRLGRFFSLLPLLSLLPLFLFVLIVNFEPLNNRIAIALTIAFAGSCYLLISRWLRRRQEILLSPLPLWAVTGAVWEDALGNILFLYERWEWWDDLGHFIGTFAIVWAAFEIMSKTRAKAMWNLPSFWLGVFSVAVAMLIATFYEITEMLGDIGFGTYRVTSRLDSAIDLAWGLLACLTFFAIRAIILKIKPRKNV